MRLSYSAFVSCPRLLRRLLPSWNSYAGYDYFYYLHHPHHDYHSLSLEFTNCPATDRTTHITTETIVISTIVCPVEDATTTAEGSSPTGPSGNGNDYTISTILSTRTVTLTQCPATVTDCPARDQMTHITTETVVAGTTSVSINTAVTTTAPDAVHTSSVPVQTTAVVASTETNTSTTYSVITATGTTTPTEMLVRLVFLTLVEMLPGSGVVAGEGEGEGSTGSSSNPGNNPSHISSPSSITRTRISSATSSSFIGIHSATAKVSPATASSSTAAGARAGAGTGIGSGSTTESSSSASASPVFNGASSFAISGVLSALGAIAALALFLGVYIYLCIFFKWIIIVFGILSRVESKSHNTSTKAPMFAFTYKLD
ncbi:hypothetical protein N7527_010072 [Penicillium freii]|nr:hypothetical protein N7527_010072 [Penicillium freii]